MAVGLVSNEWNKKRQVFLLQDYTRNSLVALITPPQRARGEAGPNLEHHGNLRPTAPLL